MYFRYRNVSVRLYFRDFNRRGRGGFNGGGLRDRFRHVHQPFVPPDTAIAIAGELTGFSGGVTGETGMFGIFVPK